MWNSIPAITQKLKHALHGLQDITFHIVHSPVVSFAFERCMAIIISQY